MEITSEGTSGGYILYHGPFKVAIVQNSTYRGRRITIPKQSEPNGQANIGLHHGLPRERWKIIWTSPEIERGLLEAVMAHLETLPDAPTDHELGKRLMLEAAEQLAETP